MVEQYKDGTEVLWMAHYRKDPEIGDMNGATLKISGTTIEAAQKAQDYAEENNLILQCLRRRY